jgi:Histidine kinase
LPDSLPVFVRTPMRFPFGATGRPDWIQFNRRDLALAVTLGAATTVVNFSASFRLLRERSLLDLAGVSVQMVLSGFVHCVVLVAALEALERVALVGWRRHLATAATGMAVAAIITGAEAFGEWPTHAIGTTYGIASSPLALTLYAMWLHAALALIARAWLVKSREETQATTLLARMRAEHVAVRRRLVEGRLKAIQARVDPRFFFDMLDAVRRTYAVDFSRAEGLLDELTTFLRAALPRLRVASSTVGEECELVRSFARLHVLAGLGSSGLDIEVAPSIRAARFPPGVVLPVIDQVLRATARADQVRIVFRIEAMEAAPGNGGEQPVPPRWTVVMQLTAVAAPSAEVLAEVRATLDDLFGNLACVTNEVVDAGVMTSVKVPYEPQTA